MKAIVIAIVLSSPLFSYAQPNESRDDLQRLSDDLFSSQDIAGNPEDLYENLVQLMASPLDLNKVTEEELRLLHVLNERQIEHFMSYRKTQGEILAIYELQIIPEFDSLTISRLLPFVWVHDPATIVNASLLRRMFSSGNNYFIARYERTIEKKNGFKPAQGNSPLFRGSADKLYVRLRSSRAGDYSIGMTGEKDSGEPLAFDPGQHQWGFDFTSFHLRLQDKGVIRNVVVGDFQAQFAQGLLLGGAFGLGKGGETVSTVRKANAGFLPYTSVNENACQRGFAITMEPLRHFIFSAFYSNVGRDGTTGVGADSLIVNSLQSSGLHRTESELRGRKNVREQNYGAVIQLKDKNLDAGVIINGTTFDVPLKKSPSPYNQFAFAGSANLNAGIFINYRVGNISFFSEAGRSVSGGVGGIAGLLISPHQRLDVAVVYRNYQKHFHTFYSNAFSENTQPANERGVYWGWKYQWNRHCSAAGYVDIFAFPWLGYRRYAPSGGYEWLLRGSYHPSRRVSLYGQVREESKAVNGAEMTTLYVVKQGLRRHMILHSNYGIGESITFRSRLQYNTYSVDGSTTEGIALIQDVAFQLGAFKFTGRHALFDSERYDNRLYVYEHDGWLAYSLPAYSGVGVRNYVLFEYKVHRQLTVWLRYARTRLIKPGEIGTGPDVIEGNTRNDVKFQARFEF